MEDFQSLQNFLSPIKYRQVISMLTSDQCWRKVISTLENYSIIFSEHKMYIIETSESPPTKLLDELYYRTCPVLLFREVLRNSNLLNILAIISDPEPLTIIKQPGNEDETVYLSYGEDLKLECEAVGLPPPSYLWCYENKELDDQTSPTLRLSEFKEGNIGEYSCIISQRIEGDLISVRTKSVNVDLMPEAPNFTKNLAPCKPVAQNCSVTLSVEVESWPPPIFEWIFKNNVLEGQNSNRLKLKKVTLQNEGEYRCIAKNGSGKNSCSVSSLPCELRVYSPPDQASAKVALLIANQDYHSLSKLCTPRKDVMNLASILRDQLGFYVFPFLNLTLVEMKNVFTWFFKLLPANAYAVVYFGGHGFKYGESFMMPVDCPSENYGLVDDCFCVEELIQIATENSPNLQLLYILLDMCQKHPSDKNLKIQREKTPRYCYKLGKCGLVMGTSTSYHLNAYEEPQSETGLYVKYLSKHLAKDIDIQQILDETIKDFRDNVPYTLQKPVKYADTSNTYKLTDPCCEQNPQEKEKFNTMRIYSNFSKELELNFKCTKFNNKHVIFVQHHEGYFINSIDITFRPVIKNWIVSADVNCEELNYYWCKNSGKLIIHNIQKAKTALCATIKLNSLHNDRLNLVDYCAAELPCPIIQEALWFKKGSHSQ